MTTDYREYKNGIYGLRYRGLYIIPVDDKCQVVDNKGYLVIDDLKDREDGIWAIEKRKASEQEKEVLEFLYKKTVPELTTYMMEYYNKSDAQSKYVYKMSNLIRDRKEKDREW